MRAFPGFESVTRALSKGYPCAELDHFTTVVDDRVKHRMREFRHQAPTKCKAYAYNPPSTFNQVTVGYTMGM